MTLRMKRIQTDIFNEEILNSGFCREFIVSPYSENPSGEYSIKVVVSDKVSMPSHWVEDRKSIGIIIPFVLNAYESLDAYKSVIQMFCKVKAHYFTVYGVNQDEAFITLAI